jgi:hypothetical protein
MLMDVIEPRLMGVSGGPLPPDDGQRCLRTDYQGGSRACCQPGRCRRRRRDAWFADPLDALNDPMSLPTSGCSWTTTLSRAQHEPVLVFQEIRRRRADRPSPPRSSRSRGVRIRPTYVPIAGRDPVSLAARRRRAIQIKLIVTVDCG